MKGFLWYTVAMSLLCFQFSATALTYNTWYQSKGVMTDATQTDEGGPVLISLAYRKMPGAHLVVAYNEEGDCQDISDTEPFVINQQVTKAAIKCYQLDNKIRSLSYLVNDISYVDYFDNQLSAGFTVVLQNNIRVWVENYNHHISGFFPLV
ncbi:TPA: hypothetical protein N2N45_003887 [Klebsiella aerogenes]|nr:hypothetical protein [Klebsiella aerogenes]